MKFSIYLHRRLESSDILNGGLVFYVPFNIISHIDVSVIMKGSVQLGAVQS